MAKRWKKYSIGAGAILFWLLLWQFVCRFVGQELLLPSPLRTFTRLVQLMGQWRFWQAAFASLLRILTGTLLGIALGLLLGTATALSAALHILLKPLFAIVKATPVASFIILALIWMHRDFVPVFACALMVLPIVWANIREGILQTPKDLKEMVRLFRFTPMQKLKRLTLPQLLPYFAAACNSSIGLSWKAGIAAEVLSFPLRAVGTQLHNAKVYLETPDLFAWTAVVILLSITLERGTQLLLGRISSRREGA